MTFKKWLSLKKYPYSWYRDMSLKKNIVQFLINKRIYENDCFKVGDVVSYNWRAKWHLGNVYKERAGKRLKITHITYYPSDYTFGYYVDENGEIGSCDSFWISKI